MQQHRSTGGPRTHRGPPATAPCVGESLVDLICERPVVCPGCPQMVVDTTGAGDALLGVVLAALASSGYDPAAAAASLRAAVECTARTTEHFGALG